MKKKKLIIGLVFVTAVLVVAWMTFLHSHAYTLSDSETAAKAEQIQPITGKVEVFSSCDTDVVFINVETGKTYLIGYVTHGMSETIQLERGEWYRVEGAGTLTMRPVNIRIE